MFTYLLSSCNVQEFLNNDRMLILKLSSSMVLYVHRNHVRRTNRSGRRGRLYLSQHCHHQKDSCIKMGSDESHINVSLICEGQCHKRVSTNHNFFYEKGQPERNRAKALLLTSLKPVLNWANCLFAEHTSDSSTNYNSFLNLTFLFAERVQAVRRTMLRS